MAHGILDFQCIVEKKVLGWPGYLRILEFGYAYGFGSGDWQPFKDTWKRSGSF